MTKHLTKAQALKGFKSEVDIKSLSKTDRRVLWNMHVEYLRSEGAVSERQASTWANPFN